MKIAYKNIGMVSKTFYGVNFNPGETKEVDGYINANSFVRVDNPSNCSRNIKAESPTNPITNKSEIRVESKSNSKSDSKSEVKLPDPKKGSDKSGDAADSK